MKKINKFCFAFFLPLIWGLTCYGCATKGYVNMRCNQAFEKVDKLEREQKLLDVSVSARIEGIESAMVKTIGKAFDESSQAKADAEKAISDSSAALQAAGEAKKEAAQAAGAVIQGMQMEVTAIQARLEQTDKKIKLLDETARIAREESSRAKAASADALYKAARSIVQSAEILYVMAQINALAHPETFSDISLKHNITNISKRTGVLSEAIITNFGRRKWGLSPPGCKKLDQLCSEIAGMDYSIITVTGFADPSGSKKVNFLLGRKRAESVKEYLIKKGLDKDRIMASSLGDSVVFVSNETEEGRRQNRRVEVRVWN